jgi:hypothetical protein
MLYSMVACTTPYDKPKIAVYTGAIELKVTKECPLTKEIQRKIRIKKAHEPYATFSCNKIESKDNENKEEIITFCYLIRIQPTKAISLQNAIEQLTKDPAFKYITFLQHY